MTPDPADDSRKQTKDLERYLRNCCRICLIPHRQEVHDATLRIREFGFGRYRAQRPDSVTISTNET